VLGGDTVHLGDEPSRGLKANTMVRHEGIPYDHEIGREGGLDVSWHEPVHDLLRKAVAQGRADQSIASLVELLRNP
jgi:hypothetical protein